MKFPGRITSGVLMLLTSCAALAQSELDVRIKPSNDELKANIEGYVGSLGDRDEEALLRFSRGPRSRRAKPPRPWVITSRRSTAT
jgi:translocation and assembly module TamA